MVAHTQTWVKVNAPVDEGIAPLVETLSAIPGVETLESCQGDPGQAFVLFRYKDWRSCGALMFERLLPALSFDLRAEVSFALRSYDSDSAIGELRAEPAVVPALVVRLRELCHDLP